MTGNNPTQAKISFKNVKLFKGGKSPKQGFVNIPIMRILTVKL